jgi:hypothetical protein
LSPLAWRYSRYESALENTEKIGKHKPAEVHAGKAPSADDFWTGFLDKRAFSG